MTDPRSTLPVPGSRRHALAGARRLGDAPPDEEVLVTVVLRPGATQADADLVWQFASDSGIEVAGVNLPARSVRLRGDVAAMNAAFGVSLGTFVAGARTYRGREGSVYLPERLDGTIIAVLGLDSRPQAKPHFRYAPGYALRPEALAPRAATAGLSVPQIASMYDFPPDVTGTGQTVAIIELGGGYSTDDLAAYFESLSLPVPVIESVGVDGAGNSPGDDADGEVMLDIEVVGAVAPGAHIVVYFAPNTTNGFYDAIAAAMHDTARTPSVISISWGQAESGWTASAMDAYDALFADAAELGITIYAAAGDDGADRRFGRRRAAGRLPVVQPVRGRLRRHPALDVGRGRLERAGVRQRGDRWRLQRTLRRARLSAFVAGIRARPTVVACRTSRATPIRSPDIRSGSTARTW